MARVLVAVDFSELTDRTVQYAAQWAQARQMQVDVVHVLASSLPVQMQSHAPAEIIDRIIAAEEDDAREQLFQLLTLNVPESIRGQAVIRRGTPSETICELAEKGDYELVVVSTQGRTGLAHVLVGSVAERVVRFSTTPVLVVR